MKLSIITINFNNLEGLKRTYESVVTQTCQDFEWIVIDGGSIDGSREFIDAHQEKFAFWCSEPDKGVYNAMNKGISKAKGEYLNFMNSGDCFYDDSTIMNVLSQPMTADLIYGDWVRVFHDHEVFKKAPEKDFHLTVFFENVCHQAMFIKTDVLRSKGYDEEMRVYADWKRWMEMSLDGQSFQYIPFTICSFEAGTGLSEHGISNEEYELLVKGLPDAIGNGFRCRHNDYLKIWEYKHNPLISEAIRLSNQGKSYKTKILHLTLLVIKWLERF